MSYILDALRKSEQQRQHGVAPGLLAVHTTYAEHTRPAFLTYGLIAAVLIGAGVAIGWLRPWQQEQGLSATASRPAEPEAKPRLSLPAPLPVLPETRKSGQERPAQPSLVAAKPAPAREVITTRQDVQAAAKPPAQARKSPPKPVAVLPRETATPIPEITTAPPLAHASAPLQEKLVVTAPTATAQEQKVISMAELPQAIQQEIPVMSIPLHSYSSTPTERIVGINERLLQEGDFLAPGLRLEQITPDGMIFSYKTYRFRRGL